MITAALLRQCYAQAVDNNIARFAEALDDTCREFQIDSPLRVAMFLAQVGHESGQLRYVREIASGQAYEGRRDLGNVRAGDGVKYKGRGLIQITGRSNYAAVSQALYADRNILLDAPEKLEDPVPAARSAGWYWSTRQLNRLADALDIVGATRAINGGINGLADRRTLYDAARKALGVA